MTTFRVILLPRAEADIEANAHWWATHHSVEQAALWFDAMHEQLESLAHFPESNGLSIENDEFPYERPLCLARSQVCPKFMDLHPIPAMMSPGTVKSSRTHRLPTACEYYSAELSE